MKSITLTYVGEAMGGFELKDRYHNRYFIECSPSELEAWALPLGYLPAGLPKYKVPVGVLCEVDA